MTACVYVPPADPVVDQDTDDDDSMGDDPSELVAACFASGTLLCLEFERDAGMLDGVALDGSGNKFDASTEDVVTYQRLMTPTVEDADAAGFSVTSSMTITKDIGLTGSVTLEMWAQTSSEATLFDSNGRFYLSRNRDNHLECGINGGSSDQRVDGGTSLDGNWHHVACVFDAQTGDIKVFVDGEVDDCKRLDGRTIQPNPGSTTLDGGLLGAIDAVRVYNRVLPGSELCKSAGRTGCNEICPIEGGFNGGGGFGGGGFGGGGG